MSTITIRLDDRLHRRLKLRAAHANLSVAAFLRPLIEDAAYPGGRYVYTGQDELIGIAIQTFSLVAELAAAQSPSILERGMTNARAMLRERGLLDPQNDPLAEAGRVDTGSREARR